MRCGITRVRRPRAAVACKMRFTRPCGKESARAAGRGVRDYRRLASDCNRSMIFGPIPRTRRTSSHEVNEPRPRLASTMREASTGPMPGRSSSESAGAVERKARGSRLKAGSTEGVAGRREGPRSRDTRRATPTPGTGAESSSVVVSEESGGALPPCTKRYERSAAPSPMTSTPAPSTLRTHPTPEVQSNSVHSIPYTNVAGVIK